MGGGGCGARVFGFCSGSRGLGPWGRKKKASSREGQSGEWRDAAVVGAFRVIVFFFQGNVIDGSLSLDLMLDASWAIRAVNL